MVQRWIGRVRSNIRWGKTAKFLFWLHVSICLPAILFLAGILCYINYWHYDFDGKLVNEFLNYKPPLVTEILYHNGETMIKFPGIGDWTRRIPEYRVWVKFKDIPALMRNSILAAEDQRFFDHNGLDYWPGMVRALGENILETGRASVHAGKLRLIFAEGASTLTQQAIELTLFRDSHERELRGELTKFEKFATKVDKMRMAVWLEEQLKEKIGKLEAKKRIFEIVANVSYCGQGQYGIAEGANFFFGKKLTELTAPEAATIAALFRSPEKYSPYRNSVMAIARRNGILKVMSVWNYIPPSDLTRYYSETFTLARHANRKTEAPAVAQYVLRELWSKGTDSIRWENGVKVVSTVDRSSQLIANDAVSYGLKLFKERQFSHANGSMDESDRKFFETRAKGIQGALVVLQNGTGEILAMVGGASNEYMSFNRAVEAMRQPGSAFKSFVYGTAIEMGKDAYRIDCLREGRGACRVSDSPISVKMGRNKPRHSIHNYDGRVFGSIPIWVAVARSQNMAAMHIGREVGIDNVINFANRLGLNLGPHAYPTTAIGAEEVTVLGLASAYSTFPSLGVHARPYVLSQVTNSQGEKIFYYPMLKQAIAPDVSETIVELLRHPVLYRSGTARSINEKGYTVPVAGKTGTSNKFRDTWFCGFTYGIEGITACAWVGMDDRTSLATGKESEVIHNPEQRCAPLHPKKKEYCEAGGKTALPIVRYFLAEYYKDKTPPQFPEAMDAWVKHVHERDYDPTSAKIKMPEELRDINKEPIANNQ